MPLACQALALLVSCAAGADLPPDLRRDIEFARVGEVSLTLDVHVPAGRGPFPAVIVVHGGGFIRGDKQTFVGPLFAPLTSAGFTWFTINYRLAPQHRFPAAVEDVERAVRWVRAHAREYKADPNRIALMGESAGGHLVSFAGARSRGEARVAAVVSFYGPHDLEARAKAMGKISDTVQAFLGVSELNEQTLRVLREASPITHVHRGMPPYLLIHGTQDRLVPHQQSIAMCEKMKKAGASCELFLLEGAGHGVGSWEKEPAHHAYKAKMIEWLNRQFQQ